MSKFSCRSGIVEESFTFMQRQILFQQPKRTAASRHQVFADAYRTVNTFRKHSARRFLPGIVQGTESPALLSGGGKYSNQTKGYQCTPSATCISLHFARPEDWCRNFGVGYGDST